MYGYNICIGNQILDFIVPQYDNLGILSTFIILKVEKIAILVPFAVDWWEVPHNPKDQHLHKSI